MKYQVQSLDAWGNEDDGFVINNVFVAGTVKIPKGLSDKETIELLREEWLDGPVSAFTIDDLGEDMFAVNLSSNDKPLLQFLAVLE